LDVGRSMFGVGRCSRQEKNRTPNIQDRTSNIDPDL